MIEDQILLELDRSIQRTINSLTQTYIEAGLDPEEARQNAGELVTEHLNTCEL